MDYNNNKSFTKVYFIDAHKDMELTSYQDILKNNNIEWDLESMKNDDISNLNVKCILALIMGANRAKRVCDGSLLDFFESGCILKWLERLNNIVNSEMERK